MRKITFKCSLFSLALFCVTSNAAEFDGVSCQKISEAVSLVAVSRDMGMSKQDTSSMLPAAESPLKKSMLLMLDEVYGNTDISAYSYMPIKLSQCEAEKSGKQIKSLGELKPLIVKCQDEFGIKASDKLNECIAKIGVEKTK